MKQLTLEQALELVHPWLGTWQPGKCKPTDVTCRHFDQPWFDHDAPETKRWLKEGGELPPFAEHDIPMPPATDELAMQVLRKLTGPHMLISLHWGFGEGEWIAEIGVWGLAEPYAQSNANNPRDAIIIAAGMWLLSKGT